MVNCEVCDKHMNNKSIAKHMREQHNMSGPGKPLKWTQSGKGDWIRKKANENIDEVKNPPKRKAGEHLSPADKGETRKKENVETIISPQQINNV